jgi:hypothetical protein
VSKAAAAIAKLSYPFTRKRRKAEAAEAAEAIFQDACELAALRLEQSLADLGTSRQLRAATH